MVIHIMLLVFAGLIASGDHTGTVDLMAMAGPAGMVARKNQVAFTQPQQTAAVHSRFVYRLAPPQIKPMPWKNVCAPVKRMVDDGSMVLHPSSLEGFALVAPYRARLVLDDMGFADALGESLLDGPTSQ